MKKETIKQAVAPYMQELAGLADQIYDLAFRPPSVLSMNREKEDLPLDSWQSTTR